MVRRKLFWGVPLGLYVHERNGRVPESARVMTSFVAPCNAIARMPQRAAQTMPFSPLSITSSSGFSISGTVRSCGRMVGASPSRPGCALTTDADERR